MNFGDTVIKLTAVMHITSTEDPLVVKETSESCNANRGTSERSASTRAQGIEVLAMVLACEPIRIASRTRKKKASKTSEQATNSWTHSPDCDAQAQTSMASAMVV